MPSTQTRPPGVHPLHAILLAFPAALFPAALATDVAYLRTEEIQWTNFSSWLIAGGLVFAGFVLAWALVVLMLQFRSRHRLRHSVYAGLLGGLFVVGLINAFQHSRDGWSSVGTFGLVLSVICAGLALAAAALAHSRLLLREDAQ